MTKISSNDFDTILERLRKNDPTLTSLDLWNNQIGGAGAKAIAKALETNTTLTELNLIDNQIGDEGVKAIAKALETNTTLTELNLTYNQISDEGVKAIAEVLQHNQTLTKLNLTYNQISDEGAKAIAKALETNTTLTELNLGDNQIGDEGAKAIAKALETNTTLTKLDLIDNQIGDEGAKAIATALRHNQILTKLNLGYNQIGDEGAKAIATALETNTTLTKLDLIDNQIGDEGTKAIAEVLQHNQTLMKLNLTNNYIATARAKAIATINSLLERNQKIRNVPQTTVFEHDKKEIKRTAITQEAASEQQHQGRVIQHPFTPEQEQLFAQGAVVGAFRNAKQQNPSLPDTEEQGEVYSYIATFLDPLSATRLAMTCRDARDTAKLNAQKSIAQENSITALPSIKPDQTQGGIQQKNPWKTFLSQPYRQQLQREALPPLNLPPPPAPTRPTPTERQPLLGTQRETTSGEKEAKNEKKAGLWRKLTSRLHATKSTKEKQPVSKEDKALASLEKQYSAACEQKPGIARDDALEKVLKKGNELLLRYENDSAKQESLAKLVENAFLAMGTEEKPSLGQWTAAVARSSKREHTPSNQPGKN